MGIISHTPRKHVAYFSPNNWNVGLHLNLAVRPLFITRTRPFMRIGGEHLFLIIDAANTQSFHENLHMLSLLTVLHRKPKIVTLLFYTTSMLTNRTECKGLLIKIWNFLCTVGLWRFETRRCFITLAFQLCFRICP
jgi:hypothetical protein